MPTKADGAEASRPLMHETDTDGNDKSDYDSAPTSKSIELATTDDEGESTARLSRRSSVLNDIMALFRRSSSALVRHHTTNAKFLSGGEEDDDEDGEETHAMNKERILEAIQQKREIIGKLRIQPWNMKRKRRTLKVAQKHLQRQEAKVSKAQLYKAELGRRLTQLSRWFNNFKIYLIPWEAKIKRIESHYGSVVSSYFTFLRWTLGVNIIMTLIMLLFVTIPEWLADSKMEFGSERYNRTASIKVMPDDVRKRADEISTIWDFGVKLNGFMQYSLMFYGYYSRETFFGETVKYKVPVAYFLANLFVLGYSFFTILRKMASNARNSKLSSGKTEQYVFNWKSFTGWDYTIGNSETASNVHMANVIKFREAIAEFSQNLKTKLLLLQLFTRIGCWLIILAMLSFSVWAIIKANFIKDPVTFVEQNAVALTVSFITLIFPNIFDLIGKLEGYHPRTALRLQLARVCLLYILNYYTLIYSLMTKLNELKNEQDQVETAYQKGIENDYLHYAENVTLQRSLRQILGLPSPTPHVYFSYTKVTTSPPIIPDITTTPAAPKPWTTVFADFGPIGISNPRVVVSPDRHQVSDSVVLTQVIGPNLDWNASTTRLNISTPVKTYTQSFAMHKFHRNMCWETIIGQEITKLVTMDLLMTIAAILVIDFLRGLFCRWCNNWWCWNLEKTFPEYGEFKVAENVLHLVNNQGMIWLGFFFVPMLPMLNNIKLIILMYIRAWAVMTCNVPARQIFRASRSSNFYLMLLLLMLMLCTIPVGIVIASQTPSRSCGPFGNQPYFYSVITDILHENLNSGMVEIIKHIMSPGIIIPVLVFLLLIIYFLVALVRGLKEANKDLTTQLMHERTEEKKKIFELAGGRGKKKEMKALAKKKQQEMPPTPDLKPDRPRAVFTSGHVSSDEDTAFQRVISPTNKNPSMRTFVPSLGSVSEVDHSIDEEEEFEPEPIPKLSFAQRFMICIGLKDREDYEDKIEPAVTIEEGNRNATIEEEEEEPDYKNDSEKKFLLPPSKRNTQSRERSTTSHRSEREKSGQNTQEEREDSSRTSMREYRTPSVSRHSDEKQRESSKPSTPQISSRRLEKEYVVPQINQLAVDSDDQSRRTNSAQFYNEESDSRSASHGGSLQLDEPSRKEIENTARRLLQPLSSSHTKRYGPPPPIIIPADIEPRDTRPPSTDGSLSDPSPVMESAWYASNPHSSYTSAMMSPIMNDMLSTDEGTDDEKARLIKDRPNVDSPRTSRSRPEPPSTPKPPKFRISASPPRKKASDDPQRRFEMRVDEGEKKKKRKEETIEEETEKQTTV